MSSKVESLKESGNKCFKNRDYRNAITYYKKGLEIEPRNIHLNSNIAQAYLADANFVEAEVHAVVTLAQHQDSVKGYYRAARAANLRMKKNRALAYVHKGLAMCPESEELLTLCSQLKENSVDQTMGSGRERKKHTENISESESDEESRLRSQSTSRVISGSTTKASVVSQRSISVSRTTVITNTKTVSKSKRKKKGPIETEDIQNDKFLQTAEMLRDEQNKQLPAQTLFPKELSLPKEKRESPVVLGKTYDWNEEMSQYSEDLCGNDDMENLTKISNSKSGKGKGVQNLLAYDNSPTYQHQSHIDYDGSPLGFGYVSKQKLLQLMKEGSEMLEKGLPRKAAESYKEALDVIIGYDMQVFGLKEIDNIVLKYSISISWTETANYVDIVRSIEYLNDIEEKHSAKLPAVYYALGNAFYKLNRFKAALEHLERGINIVEKGLKIITHPWPGTTNIIKETTKIGLEESLLHLIQSSKLYHVPNAICRHQNCLKISTHIIPSENIYYSDPDYIGFVVIKCQEACRVKYHIGCWKDYKESISAVEKLSDKDLLGKPCLTFDCVTENKEQSVIVGIEIYGENGDIKSQCSREPVKAVTNIKETKKGKKKKGATDIMRNEKGKIRRQREHKLTESVMVEPRQSSPGVNRESEPFDDGLKQLACLRSSNFGYNAVSYWYPNKDYFGRNDIACLETFLDSKCVEDSQELKEKKNFVFSYFYEFILSEGAQKMMSVEEKWKKEVSHFPGLDEFMSCSDGVCKFLLESYRFAAIDDYLCLSAQLSSTYIKAYEELQEGVSFMIQNNIHFPETDSLEIPKIISADVETISSNKTIHDDEHRIGDIHSNDCEDIDANGNEDMQDNERESMLDDELENMLDDELENTQDDELENTQDDGLENMLDDDCESLVDDKESESIYNDNDKSRPKSVCDMIFYSKKLNSLREQFISNDNNTENESDEDSEEDDEEEEDDDDVVSKEELGDDLHYDKGAVLPPVYIECEDESSENVIKIREVDARTLGSTVKEKDDVNLNLGDKEVICDKDSITETLNPLANEFLPPPNDMEEIENGETEESEAVSSYGSLDEPLMPNMHPVYLSNVLCGPSEIVLHQASLELVSPPLELSDEYTQTEPGRDYEEEIEKLNDAIAEMEGELQEMKDSKETINTELQAEIKKRDDVMKNYEEKIVALQNQKDMEIHSLQLDIAKKDTKTENMKKKHCEKMDKLNKKLEEESALLKKSQTTVQELTENVKTKETLVEQSAVLLNRTYQIILDTKKVHVEYQVGIFNQKCIERLESMYSMVKYLTDTSIPSLTMMKEAIKEWEQVLVQVSEIGEKLKISYNSLTEELRNMKTLEVIPELELPVFPKEPAYPIKDMENIIHIAMNHLHSIPKNLPDKESRVQNTPSPVQQLPNAMSPIHSATIQNPTAMPQLYPPAFSQLQGHNLFMANQGPPLAFRPFVHSITMQANSTYVPMWHQQGFNPVALPILQEDYKKRLQFKEIPREQSPDSTTVAAKLVSNSVPEAIQKPEEKEGASTVPNNEKELPPQSLEKESESSEVNEIVKIETQNAAQERTNALTSQKNGTASGGTMSAQTKKNDSLIFVAKQPSVKDVLAKNSALATKLTSQSAAGEMKVAGQSVPTESMGSDTPLTGRLPEKKPVSQSASSGLIPIERNGVPQEGFRRKVPQESVAQPVSNRSPPLLPMPILPPKVATVQPESKRPSPLLSTSVPSLKVAAVQSESKRAPPLLPTPVLPPNGTVTQPDSKKLPLQLPTSMLPPKMVVPKTEKKVDHEVKSVTSASSKRGNYQKLINELQKKFPTKSETELSDCVATVREKNNNTLTGLTVSTICHMVEKALQVRTSGKQGTMGLDKFGGAAWGGVKNSTTTWNKPKDDVEEECIICMNIMTSNVTSLQCKHTFHSECIRKWLKEESVCPICREFTRMTDEFPPLG